jgi:hypothetical protein
MVVIQNYQPCFVNETRNQCGFLSLCTLNMTSFDYKCVPMYTISNGVQIPDFSFRFLCESNTTVQKSDNWYCINGFITDSTLSLGYPNGTMCNYTRFDNPLNLSQGTPFQEPAKCGFSSNGLAYCDQGKGD